MPALPRNENFAGGLPSILPTWNRSPIRARPHRRPSRCARRWEATLLIIRRALAVLAVAAVALLGAVIGPSPVEHARSHHRFTAEHNKWVELYRVRILAVSASGTQTVTDHERAQWQIVKESWREFAARMDAFYQP